MNHSSTLNKTYILNCRRPLKGHRQQFIVHQVFVASYKNEVL